jgi:membrane-bound ClpP family serine protease
MYAALEGLAIIGTLALALAIFVATVSRHKKSGTGPVRLVGVVGFVNTKLDPEGTVIVDGELWRACARDGEVVGPTIRVTVIGLQSHLLLVQPMPDRL